MTVQTKRKKEREELYRLLDRLPDEQLTGMRVLLEAAIALVTATSPPALPASLANAPVDDEPDDDDFDGGLTEARADRAAGRVESWHEVQKKLDW